MTMTPHSTSAPKLEDPEDLLLSYLNADYLDTTNATTPALDMINSNPSLSPSSASFDSPFSPHTNHPSPWSSIPFLFNVNALASVCMESPDLTAGISPCSISRFGSPSSPDRRPSLTCFTPTYSTASHLPDTKDYQPPTATVPSSSSASSPTISTVTSVSSSDVDEPKRKRERKKQRQQHGSPPIMMHNCKPILPAASHQHHHLTSPPPACSLVHVKPEPTDINTSSVLTALDNSSNNNRCETTTKAAGNRPASSNNKRQTHGSAKPNGTRQQHPAVSTTDAHNKRQERLIKNRAAALLSRKRKREHLQALEHERQWLSKDNDVLKSKTTALQAKVHMLEKEKQYQKQQYLLLERQLQQQQQQQCFNKDGPLDSSECNTRKHGDDDDTMDVISVRQPSHSIDPISKVTNVLMILLISFVLLTLPVTSDRQLNINKDKDTPSTAFTSNNANEKNMSSLYVPLVLQQQQHHLHESTDESMDSALDHQHTPPLHHPKPYQGSKATSLDHIRLPPSPISIRKRKRDLPETNSDSLPH